MIEGYEFIYALSYKGQVFYIGRSADALRRYDQHIAACLSSQTRVARFISILRAFDGIPMMRIIDYLPKTEAMELENQLIAHFKAAGQDILNGSSAIESTFCYRLPKWASENPQRKEIREIINYWMKYRVLAAKFNH